ncbi:Slk19p [Lachancea thermotolerans CBS 6340]|uniref:KLTH0D09504p n=1 Tax=Lachancea thermotolerans (strain ATCC 56472 / CBS 6340 / NRRL Y-8284) TaxID=559295 RepID=C5DGZ3_LACTC|nr:KLTH0D09504p [Lachancea thermotolerans CBS 6340]CAR22685.1 KLTH0D09504p [Lachancea thermotolerans CBS 6340]
MGDSNIGSFSTPLKNGISRSVELRVPNSERPYPKGVDSPGKPANDDRALRIQKNNENASQLRSSPWKRAKLDKFSSRSHPVSSPAVIEMLDRNVSGPHGSLRDSQALEIQDEISEAISSAVREVSGSDSSNHDNQHRTSLINDLLSPRRDGTPDHIPDADLANLGKLTPPKNYMHNTESSIIQNLQSCFRDELGKFEQYLKAKNEQADEYRRRTVDCFEKIKQLEEALDEQKLTYSSLLGEYEMLRASQSVRDDQWQTQNREIEKLSTEKTSLEERVSRLKLRLSEARNEMKMINQNSQILQEKFQTQIQQNERLQNQVSELEDSENQLRVHIENTTNSKKRVEEEIERTRAELALLTEGKFKTQSENEDLKLSVSKAQTLLAEKTKFIEELQANLRASHDTKQKSTIELEQRINDLTLEKNELVRELEDMSTLRSKIEESENEIQSVKTELDRTQVALQHLKEEHSELREHCRSLEAELKTSHQKLETANDQLAIKSAEVVELGHDVKELRQGKSHLEDSLKLRDASISEWNSKYEEKCAENNKLSIEIESFQFKNGNLETEHLVELEQLHQQMTSLQETLKSNSERIKELTEENSSLKDQLEVRELPQPQQGPLVDPEQVEELHAKIQSLEQQLREKEAEAGKRLQLLAEDLYIQYSSKHEQKVKMLKKGYESKYQDKLERLGLENSGLKDELMQLNDTLKAEREEKHNLVKLLNK